MLISHIFILSPVILTQAKWMETCGMWILSLLLLSVTLADRSQPSFSEPKEPIGENCPLVPGTWTQAVTCCLSHTFTSCLCSSFPYGKQQLWLHLPFLFLPLNFNQEVCASLILKTALPLCCFCFVKRFYFNVFLTYYPMLRRKT